MASSSYLLKGKYHKRCCECQSLRHFIRLICHCWIVQFLQRHLCLAETETARIFASGPPELNNYKYIEPLGWYQGCEGTALAGTYRYCSFNIEFQYYQAITTDLICWEVTNPLGWMPVATERIRVWRVDMIHQGLRCYTIIYTMRV